MSDCKVIDSGSLLKRVVTRDDDKVLSTEQFGVSLVDFDVHVSLEIAG